MKRFFRNNGLSLVLATLFLVFWAGQAVSGWKVHNEDAALHQQPPADFPAYLRSGHFWQATGENWESEFLQMGAYVMLTCFLFQKGSAESKDPEHPDEGRMSAARRQQCTWIYRNSVGGLAEENAMRAGHHLPEESLTGFLSSPEFWFQSFQNWQSEFLAVFAIVVLSIFLRQEGSPESKEVTAPDSETGG